MEKNINGLNPWSLLARYKPASKTELAQEQMDSSPEKARRAEIHRFFKKEGKPSPEDLHRSAALALLAPNDTPEKKEAKTILSKITCFKTLADYCNAVHAILEKQQGELDHTALYELSVKAVAHIDKIGQNLVDVIMPKNLQEWRVFAEEMAVHFLNLPVDLAKHRTKA